MLTNEIRDDMTRLYQEAATQSSVIDVSRISAEIAEKYDLDETMRKAVMATLVDAAAANRHAVEMHQDVPRTSGAAGAGPAE